MPTLARTLVNLHPNPSFEGGSFYQASTILQAFDTAWSETGTRSVRVHENVNRGGSDAYVYGHQGAIGPYVNRVGPIAAGDHVSGRVRVKAIADIRIFMTVNGYLASGAGAGTGSQFHVGPVVDLLAGEEYTYEFKDAVVADGAAGPSVALLAILRFREYGTGAIMPVGDAGDSYAYVDGWALYNTEDELLGLDHVPYFDGDSPRAMEDETRYSLVHSWEGTPHESRSVQLAYERDATFTYPVATRRGWRYLATHLNGDGTETTADVDLPVEEVTIEDVLSGDQAMSCKIDPAYARLRGPDDRPILQEWGSAIYAENDGDIRFGGIVTASPIQGPSMNLEITGFTGYLRDLPYTGPGYKGVKVDPLDVVRTIWGHAQGQPGGNLGMTLDGIKSGLSIGTELKQVEFDTQSGPVSFEAGPYKLNWHSTHDLARNIDDLATDTPFDYHERHFWDGDQIRHHLDIGYPRIGRRRNDLRFVYGVNVFESPTIERDGSMYASGTMVLGAGTGASMIMSLSEPPTRPGNRLRRIKVVQDDQIRSRKRAQRRAQVENQWRGRIDDINTLIVQDHPNARLGSVQVGDEVRVEGRGEWQNYDMWVRVLAIAYQPANGNIAEYTVARTDKLAS